MEMSANSFQVYWLLTLLTAVLSSATSFASCSTHRTLDARPFLLIHLDDVVSACTGGRAWIGSRVSSRSNFSHQPQDDLFREILKIWPLGRHHLWAGVPGHNVRVVSRGHHQIMEDAPPPFLGPMLDDVISDHWVHQVYPLHVLLVVSHDCGDCHLLSATAQSYTPRHGSHRSRVMEVGQDTHWLWTGHTLALCPVTQQTTAHPSEPP